MRPAAHEWDEREQTPWPIIQEAAKIGLYGFEGMAQFFADPTGLGLPLVNEELFWGDAGIGMSIMGTSLAVAAIFGQGTPTSRSASGSRAASARVDDVKVAAFCASEPNAGSDVSGVRTSAKFDEAAGEWVPQRSEGVGDERRHRRRPRRDRLGRSRARLRRPRRVRDPDERGEGDRAGREGLEARSARLAHRRRVSSTTAASRPATCSAARRNSTSASRACARARRATVAGGDADVRGIAPDGRRAGARDRARRLRVRARVRQGARAVRPQDHREPGDRVHARADEARDRRRAAARVARLVDGAQRRPVRERRGLDDQAQGRRGRRVGDRAGDPDPRRQRLHARVPRRALAPRREDLRHLRGHGRDPAARDLAARSAALQIR